MTTSTNIKKIRHSAALIIMGIIVMMMIPACLFIGSVEIPACDVLNIIFGQSPSNSRWEVIIMEMRLPMALTAALAGSALALAGLLLQTTFDNPLAGPSILGISSGSSLGVAIIVLALGGSISGFSYYAGILTGAVIGAAAVMLSLLAFSMIVRSTSMLLIVGILIGYLTSSAISLLNFFSTHEGVHSFVIWGLGTFSNVSLDRLITFVSIILILIFWTALLVKPLNALLLGQRYAENLGINITSTRNQLLIVSGALTAVVTAFCGPIGFIGLIVPHIARLTLSTSNHTTLIPATALTGAIVGLACAIVSVSFPPGVIPINAITPIIGVPVIIYIIVNRKRIHYFN